MTLVRNLLSIAFWLASVAKATEVGKEICIEGFVMDLFCINRGTLLDNPRVVTLEQPELHSFHCLLDVRTCVNSGYEILLDPIEDETIYSRGVRLDEAGNDLALEVGRAHGKRGFCTTCGGSMAQNEFGFRAVVVGTLLDMGSSDVPPLLAVTSLEEAALSAGCPDGVSDIAEMRDQFVSPVMESAGSGTSSFSRAAYIHGSLMMIGWGWLLPSGALIAKFYKHNDPLWFKIHRICQVVGLLLATVGFIVALLNFDAFGQKGFTAFNHAVMGCIVMSLGFFQPINAFFRPHKGGEGEKTPTRRLVWEVVHKTSGWVAILLAIATIGLGTTLLPANNKAFQMAYGAGAGSLLVLLTALLMSSNTQNDEGKQENDPKV